MAPIVPDDADANGSPNGEDGYGPPQAPALAINIEPVQVTPGELAEVRLAVRNDSGVPGLLQLEILGLAPDWTEVPTTRTPLAAGQTLTTSIGVRVPAGYPSSNLRAAVRASLLGPDSGTRMARSSTGDLLLQVAETGLLDASMPDEVFGSFHGRFVVSVRTRGRELQHVELSGSSPVGARVSWSEAELSLLPGAEEKVRAEVDHKRGLTGPPRRVPFSVKVQGRGAPVSLSATFVQRPWLSAWLLKTAAIVATVLVMATAAVLIVLRLTTVYAPKVTTPPTVSAPPTVKFRVRSHGLGSTLKKGSAATSNNSTASPGTGTTVASTVPRTGTTATGTTASGTTVAGSTATGSTATRSTATGTKGAATSATGAASQTSTGGSTTAPTASTTAPAASTTTAASGANGNGGTTGAAAVQMVSISGQVTAAAPADVTVTVQPASLVNEQAGSGTGGTGPFGRPVSTRTIGDGSFSFSKQFASPADYLVTFSKPGYSAQKFVVAASGSAIQLMVKLAPEPGSISGRVSGPAGPLGGATVSVSDGSVRVTARTVTVGAVGTWSITGLSTPASYLIKASAPGYGASTRLVVLGAGGSSPTVDLSLQPGVASLVGRVASASGPVGGIKVTATNGTVVQSVTTLTGGGGAGQGIVGTYVMPDLPVGAPWTVTASGNGWVSQTREVVLDSPAVERSGEATANFDLSTTSSTVTGMVESGGVGLGGADVVMKSAGRTYSALTATSPRPGSFHLSNVAPGHYLMTFSLFGHKNQVVEVNVASGRETVVPTVQMPAVSPTSLKRAQITGAAVDVATGQAVTDGTASVEGLASASAPLGPHGSYVITGLGPGIHKVRITAPGFEPVTVIVEVPMNAIATAPRALMPPLDTLSGTVRSNDGSVVPGAFVSLTPTPSSEKCGKASNPGLAPTAPTRGPQGSVPGCYAGPHGGYLIVGLPHGQYATVVESPHPPGAGDHAAPCAPGQSHPCAFYDSWAPTSGSVSLAQGRDQTVNIDMNVYGRLQAGALTPGPGGAMVAVAPSITVTGPFTCSGAPVSYATATSGAGAAVPCPTTTTAALAASAEAAPSGAPPASGTPGAPTSNCEKDGEITEVLSPAITGGVAQAVLFQGLPPGQYDVCFGGAVNSDGQPVTAVTEVAEIAISANTTSKLQTVMLPSAVTISGSLAYRANGALTPLICTPAPGAACSPGTVTATWQYYDAASNPPALLTGVFTTQVNSSGSFVFSAIPSGERIVSPSLDLQVTAGGFVPLAENNVPVPSCSATSKAGASSGGCRPGYLADITLSPLADAVDGEVVLRTGAKSTDTAAADLSRVTVSVEQENGATTPVNATVNGRGQLVWDDPNTGEPGWAAPGAYKLVFTAAGFVPVTIDKLVVPVDSSCSAQPCATISVGTVTLMKKAP